MANFPRYLTFKEGELEATLQQLGASPVAAQLLRENRSGRKGLLERHTCAVTFPDGATGVCSYTRCAATWRVFRFEHLGADGRASVLPGQRITERIADEVSAIVAASERLAESAFQEAVKREKEFFQRATSPSGTRPTEKPQMKAKRAAEMAGQYALCQPIGDNLLPVTAPFPNLEAANAAWLAQDNKSLVVACCCRFRRRWERPRFNALHTRPDYSPLPSIRVPVVPSAPATPDEDDWEDEEAAEEGSDFAPEREEE